MPSVTFQSLGAGFRRRYTWRAWPTGSIRRPLRPEPSVGQYLEQQPITTIQARPDIHIYDIERVQMLAGPQGTLWRQFPARHDTDNNEQPDHAFSADND